MGDLGEAAQALIEAPACSQLWLNDEPNQGGNRLCFYKVGPNYNDIAYLGNYCRRYRYYNHYTTLCSGSVRSYWSWDDAGYFFTPCTAIQWFGSYEQANTVNSCVAAATHVGLGPILH